MIIKQKASKLYLILFSIFLLVIGNILKENSKYPKIIISKADSALNINDKITRFFSLGNNRIISDFLWITTLLQSDLEQYEKRDKNSWMYLRFNSITNFDPLFFNAYIFGGKYLAIVKDDLIGAESLYIKGLKSYPNSHPLIYNLAFLEAFELKNHEYAIKLYESIVDDERTPPFIKTFIQRLRYTLSLDLNETYNILLEMLKDEQEQTPIYNKIEYDLFTIKAEIDIECLNKKLETCDDTDYFGEKYIKTKNGYKTSRPLIKYRIYGK